MSKRVHSLRSPNSLCHRISISPPVTTSLLCKKNSTPVCLRTYAEDKKKEKDDKKDLKPKKDAKAPVAAPAAEAAPEDEKIIYKNPNPLKALRTKQKKVDLSILPLDTAQLDYNIRVALMMKRIPLVEIKPKWEQDLIDWEAERAAEKLKAWEEASDLRLEMELKFRAAKTSKKQQKKGANNASPIKRKKTEEEEDFKGLLDSEAETKVWPLITEEDEKGNVKSLYRKLTQNLFLLIRKSESSPWIFPTIDYHPEDLSCIRKTANRGLLETIGDDVEHHIIGNAPIDFRQTSSSGKDKPNDRVFYFLTLYKYGSPDIEEGKCQDYAWVTRDEMKENVKITHG